MAGGLIQSDAGRSRLKAITDSLLARQVKTGNREGSFNAVANNNFYWDYMPPLALLAAYDDPKTSLADKNLYLVAVKNWLEHSYKQQGADGIIPPFGVGDGNMPMVESSAGVLWVASRYKEIVDKRPDQGMLITFKGDSKVLDTLVTRSVKAIAKYQRNDGLIASGPQLQTSYYTANAHIHGALSQAIKTFGKEKDSQVDEDCKAIDDKLRSGLKGFIETKQGHVPFMKGPGPQDFAPWEGHHMIVDSYASALNGINQHTQTLETDFVTAMSSRDAVEFKKQTVPSSMLMGLHGAGYKSVTINGIAKPISTLMEEQLAALEKGASTDYLHKIATACLVGYEGCDWLSPFDPKKEAAREKTKEAPPMDPAMNDALIKAKGVFLPDPAIKPPAEKNAPKKNNPNIKTGGPGL